MSIFKCLFILKIIWYLQAKIHKTMNNWAFLITIRGSFSFLGTVILIFLLPWNIQRSSILSLFFGTPVDIHLHVLKPLVSNLQQLWNCWWYDCLTLILLLIQHSLNGKRTEILTHFISYCLMSVIWIYFIKKNIVLVW